MNERKTVLIAVICSGMILSSCSRENRANEEEIENMRARMESFLQARTIAILHDTDLPDSFLALQQNTVSTSAVSVIRKAINVEQDSVQKLRLRYLQWFVGDMVEASNHDVSWEKPMGFDSYRTFAENRYGLSLEDLRKRAEALLDSTGIDFTGMKERLSADSESNLSRYNRFFPGDSTASYAQALLRTLTMENAKRPMITTDPLIGETRFTTVDVGNEVDLHVPQRDGVYSYRDAWHGIGEAAYMGNIDEHALEFKNIVDEVTPKVYGYLFRDLVSSHIWLRQRTQLPVADLKDIVLHLAYVRLSEIRLIAQETLSEIKQVEEGAVGKGQKPLRSSIKFKSLLIASQLKQYLGNSYGQNWFENPEAGRFLRRIASGGSRTLSNEILRRIQADSLSEIPLVEELRQMIVLAAKPFVATKQTHR